MNICGCLLRCCTCIALLCGLCLAAFGGFTLASMYSYMDLVDNYLISATVGVVVLGLVVSAVSFFGCYGSWSGNPKMLKIYACLKTVIFILEIGAIVAIFMFKDQAREFASTTMKTMVANFGQPGYEGFTDVFEYTQHDLKCCGVDSFVDWKDAPFSQGKNLPSSCCHIEFEGCGDNALVEDPPTYPIYDKGCLTILTTKISDRAILVIGITAILILLQALSAIMSCRVASQARENYTV